MKLMRWVPKSCSEKRATSMAMDTPATTSVEIPVWNWMPSMADTYS